MKTRHAKRHSVLPLISDIFFTTYGMPSWKQIQYSCRNNHACYEMNKRLISTKSITFFLNDSKYFAIYDTVFVKHISWTISNTNFNKHFKFFTCICYLTCYQSCAPIPSLLDRHKPDQPDKTVSLLIHWSYQSLVSSHQCLVLKIYMGQVTKLRLSCYLVLLSIDRKPGNKTATVSLPDPYPMPPQLQFTQLSPSLYGSI